MIRFFGLILLLALVCNPLRAQLDEPTVKSQSEPAIDESEQQQTPPAKPDISSDPEPKSKSQPDTTVFNPTEEISEDSPVPFPVDI